MKIPFNKPFLTGNEESYIKQALISEKHCGNNMFCNKVIDIMQSNHGFKSVFLTPSGTSALEMGALLANIQPGDEVILPSYTFSSTVNSVVIFGALPIFCEVDPTTMNIDVNKIEELITPRTKMIIPIDYAGVSCKIDQIMQIALKHNLIVMQDCAQSYGSYYKGKACGSEAHLSTFSFHETKNFNAGEGGALIVNIDEWIERAHFLQEKGTDRRLVLKGVKSKYSWVDKGSSYLLSDINAAMLFAQLEKETEIKNLRSNITEAYLQLFADYQNKNVLHFFKLNNSITINHHAFWIIFDTEENQEKFLNLLRIHEVYAYIGYLPLHSSPMGIKFGYDSQSLPLTESLSKRIVRLPFYADLCGENLNYCIKTMKNVLIEIYGF
jgi:dTDP-4-amino-4,6-dideoxygalactose transaminase